MNKIELEKNYNPKSFEERIYSEWENSGSFRPKSDSSNGDIEKNQAGSSSPLDNTAGEDQKSAASNSSESTYSVVIPPPNVTGVLHMGHALNNTLQDIVVRFHRMTGDNTLWLTGTDHAGIATQNVVEKQLKKEGTNKTAIGREEFLKRTWAVKDKHHDIITKQQRALGNSTDWARERFTMDEGLSRAVRKVFVTLYERGLLYKGKYLVNWCPRCGTALSDDEVEHIDTKGKMYHIYYPVATENIENADKGEKDTEKSCTPSDAPQLVEIATTRPETLLGDTAVAVNPNDSRYKSLIGKRLKLPLTDRTIPVIADAFVDMTFGTGVVKITPAHDPNDYQSALRNNLPMINILNGDGTLNDNCPKKYQGMTALKARDIVISDLEDLGLYKGDEDLTHSVGHCYRCNTIIEPYLSEQWFVKMEPLAKKALKAWEDGDVVFYPRKWENTYKYWLNNIKDWCISRQLWWGHRIPAWKCDKCGALIVQEDDPATCNKCGGHLTQDPDVLDTWFSSWLWPFSTLGWPDKTADLQNFYPTSALVTAYDIIFFWVSRMIMAGLEFTGHAPFHDIYIHGLVRDKQGRKMSKSLGNGMDPLDVIAEYGSDALKFTLSFMCAQGQDILIDKESFKLGSRFCNKIWNASRYLLGNLEGRRFLAEISFKNATRLGSEHPCSEDGGERGGEKKERDSIFSDADYWIYDKLNTAIKTIREALSTYRYNDAAAAAMEYFWNNFCDWYIEATKVNLREDCGDEEKDRQTTILLLLLEENLRLLHPFVPFITEEIYSKLPDAVKTSKMLITADYPDAIYECDAACVARFNMTKNIVQTIRSLRLECAVPPSSKISVALLSDSKNHNEAIIKLMAGVSDITFVTSKPAQSIGAVGDGFEVFLLLSGVDKGALKTHFEKLIADEERSRDYSKKKLSPNFLSHAPKELIESEQNKIAACDSKIAKLKEYIADLQ